MLRLPTELVSDKKRHTWIAEFYLVITHNFYIVNLLTFRTVAVTKLLINTRDRKSAVFPQELLSVRGVPSERMKVTKFI